MKIVITKLKTRAKIAKFAASRLVLVTKIPNSYLPVAKLVIRTKMAVNVAKSPISAGV